MLAIIKLLHSLSRRWHNFSFNTSVFKHHLSRKSQKLFYGDGRIINYIFRSYIYF
jgi:hypothetical protein